MNKMSPSTKVPSILLLCIGILPWLTTVDAFIQPTKATITTLERTRNDVHSSSFESFSLHMSREMGSSTNEDEDFMQMIPLTLSMIGILAIKTVKDSINYPVMLLDRHLLEQSNQQTSPLIMLCKLVGVLMFKTLHDTIYYPVYWTRQFITCTYDQECEL